jgi:hypothetical protein
MLFYDILHFTYRSTFLPETRLKKRRLKIGTFFVHLLFVDERSQFNVVSRAGASWRPI